jgi:hypothetical protein
MGNGEGVKERAESWTKKVKAALDKESTVALRDLYQGEYWSTAMACEDEADLFVVSAGLGFADVDSSGVGYGATFAAGAPDSIIRFGTGTKADVRSSWWHHLCAGLGCHQWVKHMPRTLLVAVSEPYQQAISSDLIRLADAGHRIVVITSSDPVRTLAERDQIEHVRVGQWIRMVLGGSTPCVGIRATRYLLSTNDWKTTEGTKDAVKKLRSQYLRSSEKLPQFDRQNQSDQQVREWIRKKIVSQSSRSLSKSSLLRELRDCGMKCEQKRFYRLFEEEFRL